MGPDASDDSSEGGNLVPNLLHVTEYLILPSSRARTFRPENIATQCSLKGTPSTRILALAIYSSLDE